VYIQRYPRIATTSQAQDVGHESVPRPEVSPPFSLPRRDTDKRYMSGPKAEAILSRSTDPAIKKRKKKPKNEDYVTKLEAGEGLKLRDEDEWKHGEDVEMVDGEDAPSTYISVWWNEGR
jgi:hypothetical protein